MSNNATGADNQQGSPLLAKYASYDPSETTRRTPSKNEMSAYLQGALHDATLRIKNRTKIVRFTQKK